jgi:rod shape-determining protein MreC
MESFFSRYKNLLVLMAVLLAQVVGLAVQVRRPVSGPADAARDSNHVPLIRYWVVSLISPPERLLRSMGGGFRGMWSNYIALRGVREQNKDLKAEVNRLRMEQAGLMEDARQGQRLQQLLSFKENYIYTTQPAQIIGTSGSDLSHVLWIDKGSKDGVKSDMPVITPDGIVGKIKDVLPHTSQLLLISDQTSGAGVLMESLRIRGVLRGNVLGQPQIVNITRDDRIKPGERILTSGGDGVFPRGLPVGVVERTIPDPEHDGYIALIVKPAANLGRLEEVLVITDVGEKMPAAEQQDIAQSVDEADAQKRAADILSERLPGLKDPNAPPPAAVEPPVTPTEDDPGRPPKPGVALHSDRFSPTNVAPANTLVPGQTARPVLPTENGAAPAGKPATPASAGTARPGTPATGSTTSPKPRTTTGAPGLGTTASGGAGSPSAKPAQAPAGATPSTTAPKKPKAIAPEGTGTEPPPAKPATPSPDAEQPKPEVTQPKPDVMPPGGRL